MNTILFDLDGTIGNTLPLCIEAFRDAIEPLAKIKIRDEEIVAQFGSSEEGTISALLPPEKQTEGLKRYLKQYEALHYKWPNPFDGIKNLLHYLKQQNVLAGLITGKGRESTNLTLKKYGLDDCFTVIKTGSESGPVKDKRIEEVILEYSLCRDDVLYVGDAQSDIIACRKCSIRIAVAAWSPTTDIKKLESMNPDYLFTSIGQFLDFLKCSIEK